MLVSEEFSSSIAGTGPGFRFVLFLIEHNCLAAVSFSSVAVGADSSMGDVVGSTDELWIASFEDGFWELGGVSGGLLETREEMDMGSKGIVVGLADCACAVCADEFGGFVGEHDGGVGRADMLGDDGW